MNKKKIAEVLSILLYSRGCLYKKKKETQSDRDVVLKFVVYVFQFKICSLVLAKHVI